MRKSTLIGGLAASGLAILFMTGGSDRGSEADFTRAALPAPEKLELRSELSSVYVNLPVDVSSAVKRAETAIPERLATIAEWLPNAACAKRTQWVECNSAKLEGLITRNGAIGFEIEGNTAKFRVPLKYDLTATGIGWAKYLSERKSGEFTLTVPFGIEISPASGLAVAVRDAQAASGADQIALLKGTVKLARLVDPKIKPALKAAEDDLRQALANVPARAALERSWAALAQPLELGHGSGLWLTAIPDHYGNGGFVSVDGRLVYRIAIAARLSVTEAEKAGGGKQRKSLPVLSQNPLPPGQVRIRMGSQLSLDSMQQAAEATLVRAEQFESRSDRFTEPLKVKVRSARVYPALRQIGLELDLDVRNHKGHHHHGKAHLVGRPVLDVGTGTVAIADVSFPPVSAAAPGHKGPVAPRLGIEPFASRWMGAARIDVSRTLLDALPRATLMLNQKVDPDLVLTARLTQAVPVSVELVRGGAYLLIDLVGDASFEFTAPGDETARLTPTGSDVKANSVTPGFTGKKTEPKKVPVKRDKNS